MRKNVTSNHKLKSEFTTSDHLRSTWNQLKFGWTIHAWPSLDKKSTISFLGQQYIIQEKATNVGNLSSFIENFTSRLWFTYREGFPPLLLHDGQDSSNRYGNGPDSCGKNDVVFPDSPNNEIGASTDTFLNDPSSSTNSTSSIGRCQQNSSLRSRKKQNKLKYNVNRNAMQQWDKIISAFSKRSSNISVPLSLQTSDCGWGCVFRCGQMLLAQALIVHFLGRDWKFSKQSSCQNALEIVFHRQIIRWFHDSWSPTAPLSLHRLLKASGKLPGEWLGPASICSALIRTMAEAVDFDKRLGEIQIYFARDRVIYSQEIMDLATGNCNTSKVPRKRLHFTDHTLNYGIREHESHRVPQTINHTSAVILLIPLMLGQEKYINPVYIPMVLRFFSDPAFIGLVGGHPKHSIYITGCQLEFMIYLDPHFCQPFLDLNGDDEFPTDSWHCPVPKIIKAHKLDPCCAVGFYCRNQIELGDLLNRLPYLFSIQNTSSVHKSSSSIPTCMVEIIDESSVI